MLILGLVGSVLATAVLYISAESILVEDAVFPVGTEPLQSVSADIRLPVPVPGTTLQIQRISSYEGPFLEDGSDTEVVNVAALHVYNAGDREITKARITLRQGNAHYVFYGEHFPPGTTVVLLEQEARTYQHGAVTYCTGWQEAAVCKQQEGILVTDKSMGTVVVTNLTDRTIQNICLYYKSWLSPPDVYMGGITYKAEIAELLPGQTQYLYPSHYATGYSKVVSVTADTTHNAALQSID